MCSHDLIEYEMWLSEVNTKQKKEIATLAGLFETSKIWNIPFLPVYFCGMLKIW